MLIDLSSVAHRLWHVSGKEADPDWTSINTVRQVRELAASHEHAAICCDSGKSFRAEIDPSYKATRTSDNRAVINHQITLAMETLRGDGFVVWAQKGMEADDLAATAVHQALKIEGQRVLIVSADKDLCALVGPRVSMKSLTSGDVMNAEAVFAKYGVWPEQMTDFISLCGDKSDNIMGCRGIGDVIAARLLSEPSHPTLDDLFRCMDKGTASLAGKPLTEKQIEKLTEFRTRAETVRSLVRMRNDADINVQDALKPRVPQDAAVFGEESDMTGDLFGEPEQTENPFKAQAAPGAPPEPIDVKLPEEKAPTVEASVEPESRAVTQYVEPTPQQSRYELQLDPRSYREVVALAKDLHTSRMFSGYGSPAAIMSTILIGREMGLPAGVSLRSIFCVEGRHALSAQLMVALVLKSGLAEYFRPVSFDAKQATWETLRKGAGNKPLQLTHTFEMAVQAGVVKDKSNWAKSPIDMLNARASSRLARLAWPDLMAGLYTPDELQESAL
jgi:5'-3' exonuclease